MDTYISSSAGLALGFQGDIVQLHKFGVAAEEEISSSRARALMKTSEFYGVGNLDKTKIRKKLYRDTLNSKTLLLFLTLFDSNIPLEAKFEISKELDLEFDKDDKCLMYVSNIMYSRMLGLYDAKSLPDLTDTTSTTLKLIKQLLESQGKIKELNQKVHELIEQYNYKSDVANCIEGFFVANGLMTKLVNSELSWQELQQKILFDLLPRIKGLSDNGAVPFAKQFGKILQAYCNVSSSSKKSHKVGSSIDNIEDNCTYKADASRTKVKNPQSRDILQSVNRQIRNVEKHLKNRKYLPAKQETRSLVEYQLANGGGYYAGLSLCRLSESAKKLCQYDLQLRWSLKATELSPEDYRTYGHLADSYFNLERYEESLQNFQKCLDGDSENYLFGIVGKARVYLEMHDLTRAWQCIDEAESFDPKDPNTLFVKGEILRAQGKLHEAITVYRKIQIEAPEDSKGFLGEASVLAELKSYEDSLKVYEQSLTLYSDRETQKVANCAVAYIYAKTGHFGEADKYIKLGLKYSNYEDIVTDLTHARILHLKGKTKKACELLQSVTKKKPHFYELHAERLHLLTIMKDFESATESHRLISDDMKNKAGVRLKYSMLQKAQGNYKDALNSLDLLKQEYPKYTLGLIERARLLKEQGDFKASRAQLEDVLKFNAKDSRALLGIQYLNAIEGNSIDNVVFDKCLTLKGTDIEGLNDNIGLALLTLNEDPKWSKEVMLEALHSKLNFKGVYGTQLSACLSIACIKQNQTHAALKYVKKVESYNDALQKAILYGEQGKKHLILKVLNTEGIAYPKFADKLKSMIIEKYLTAQNDDLYSLETLIDEHIMTIYQAA